MIDGDQGGDPACWIADVCPECGLLIEDRSAPCCPRCGTRRAGPADAAGDGS